MRHAHWDILLSIQGTLDQHTVTELRQQSPQTERLSTGGVTFSPSRHRRVSTQAAGFADKLLLSYLGSYQALKPVYQDQLVYFPFGVSKEISYDRRTIRAGP